MRRGFISAPPFMPPGGMRFPGPPPMMPTMPVNMPTPPQAPQQQGGGERAQGGQQPSTLGQPAQPLPQGFPQVQGQPAQPLPQGFPQAQGQMPFPLPQVAPMPQGAFDAAPNPAAQLPAQPQVQREPDWQGLADPFAQQMLWLQQQAFAQQQLMAQQALQQQGLPAVPSILPYILPQLQTQVAGGGVQPAAHHTELAPSPTGGAFDAPQSPYARPVQPVVRTRRPGTYSTKGQTGGYSTRG